ncbi:DUF262 domain-containing protein [Persicitalea jodogahamensis]|uniref:GmrSD restriction endonucleases N-terminal domain-containing protein n=1 Tax=Persicitalea jodogahamensis TaxID=402147 RepID=A0A8J3D3N2_9BACT|nr:DUF262 domain-containing protein [Persicitalea jodogahamensis]GHB68926.1 hypothetical protein GCM10007390_23020 [Persicitalea jodogahamensis]
MIDQIKPSVTNPTIADIYESINSGRLILRPDFQRKFVWTSDHQEDFIDTILNGYPFPEIYVSQGEIDLQFLKTTRNVIDGQQRLTTIKKYIEGDHEKKFTKILKYDQLTEDQKKGFLSYQIVMRDIGNVKEETVREIFRRINLTKFKLENIEIHNAIYDGKFIQTAKDILDNIDLTEYGVLKESEFTRMADLHFILLIMSTIENEGYFAQDREVENKVSSLNEEYPNMDKMREVLIRTFSIVSSLDLPTDSMWFRKSNFFSLIVETANHIDSIPHDLKERLLKFEDMVMSNKTNTSSEFRNYYSYMYQATHGRTARVTRGDFINKYVFS